MRIAVLLSVLLLSACANFPRSGGATGAVQENRQSDATALPAAPQKPGPVEAQPQVPSDQGDQTPKKREHNVEED
jgi:PBP1b-binding outer membrane lipoprotein LpoB